MAISKYDLTELEREAIRQDLVKKFALGKATDARARKIVLEKYVRDRIDDTEKFYQWLVASKKSLTPLDKIILDELQKIDTQEQGSLLPVLIELEGKPAEIKHTAEAREKYLKEIAGFIDKNAGSDVFNAWLRTTSRIKEEEAGARLEQFKTLKDPMIVYDLYHYLQNRKRRPEFKTDKKTEAMEKELQQLMKSLLLQGVFNSKNKEKILKEEFLDNEAVKGKLLGQVVERLSSLKLDKKELDEKEVKKHEDAPASPPVVTHHKKPEPSKGSPAKPTKPVKINLGVPAHVPKGPVLTFDHPTVIKTQAVWQKFIKEPVGERIMNDKDEREPIKLIVPSERELTESDFVSIAGSMPIKIQAEIEGADPKTRKLGTGEIFQGMQVVMDEIGSDDANKNIIGKAHVVRFKPPEDEEDEKDDELLSPAEVEERASDELYQVTCKKQSVEVAAADLLPADDVLYSMVVTVKTAADQVGTKVFKISNCDDNPEAAFKLFLIGKCLGMNPKLIDAVPGSNATLNAITNPPFGDKTLRTKEGDVKRIADIMTEVLVMSAKKAQGTHNLATVKDYITQLQFSEEEIGSYKRPRM